MGNACQCLRCLRGSKQKENKYVYEKNKNVPKLPSRNELNEQSASGNVLNDRPSKKQIVISDTRSPPLSANRNKLKKESLQKNSVMVLPLGATPSDGLIELSIAFLNGKTGNFSVSGQITIRQLRKLIYNHYDQSYLPQQFLFMHLDKVLQLNMGLKKWQKGLPKNRLKAEGFVLIQTLANVWEIEGLKAQPEIVERDTQERGVAFMSCNHYFSRLRMNELINSQIDKGSACIVCPVAVNGYQCDCRWNFLQMRLVAGLSLLDFADVQQELMVNAVRHLQKKMLPVTVGKQFIAIGQRVYKAVYRRICEGPFMIIKQWKKRVIFKIQLIDKRQIDIKFQSNKTIGELKEFVRSQYYHQFKAEQTALVLEGKLLESKKKLKDVQNLRSAKVVQRVAEVWEIECLDADQYKMDEISCEEGVVRMKCGHEFGRQSMRALVRAQVSSRESQIICPCKNSDKQPCNAAWDFKEYILVAGLNQKEVSQLQEQLSINFAKNNTKECPNPKCRKSVSIVGLKTRRVKCAVCNSPDFCFTCLSQWRGSSVLCQSDVCKTLRDQVAKAPWDRSFILKRNGKPETVMTPNARACPRCRQIIFNNKACKHTPCTCVATEYSFCFVCLSLFENGKWPCGSFNNHCGFVAPNQKFD